VNLEVDLDRRPFDPAESPPVPVPTEETAFYWDAVAEHRLELLRCRSCGHFRHYPRRICDVCLSTDLQPEAVSGRGTLYSYCEVMQGSHPYFAARIPYLIGIIDLAEEPGVRLPTGIVDCVAGDLRCGIAMEVTFREVTPTLTLPFWRPEGAR
jgi:uncharacterized protein